MPTPCLPSLHTHTTARYPDRGLITTVNDLVAVLTYYGTAWFMLLKCLRLA